VSDDATRRLRALADETERLRARLDALRGRLDALRALTGRQAQDAGLWFTARTAHRAPAPAHGDRRGGRLRRPTAAEAAEWRAKLRDSGFHDLESPDTPDGFLAGNRLHHANHVATAGESAAYYRQAAAWARHRKLTPLERQVWTMHADGEPMLAIAHAVGHRSAHRVNDIIQRLRERMLGGGEMSDVRLPPVNGRGNARPRSGGTAWTGRAIQRMGDAELAALLPALLAALTTRRRWRTSSRSSRTTSRP
jgi:hypothetical protein